ncbi:DUF1616 domain-containing protein [Candidatus Harpocratesius sp.]
MRKKSADKRNQPELSLEKITRIVLVVGIICVSGAIIYTLTIPEEEDVLFFLLNENRVLRDYPTNVTQGEKIITYVFIQNLLGESHDFQIRCYRGKAETFIDPQIGVATNSNVTLIDNQNISLGNKEEWISNQINITFPEVGSDQLVLYELWIKIGDSWHYLPNYLLTLRIDVLPMNQ